MMRGKNALALALLAGALGGGCATDGAFRAERSLAERSPNTILATRAFLGETDCPRAGPVTDDELRVAGVEVPAGTQAESLGAIPMAVAGLLGKVFNNAYAAFVSYIEQRKKDLNGVHEANFVGRLYSPNEAGGFEPSYRCLVVARGRFGQPGAAGDETPSMPADPDLYAEFRMLYPNGGRNLVLLPAYVEFRRTAARNPGSGTKDVLVTVAMKRSVADGDKLKDEVFALLPVKLGRLSTGGIYGKAALYGTVSAVQELPTPDDDNPVVFDGVATFAESEEAGPLYSILVGALNDGKSDVQKAVDERIRKLLGEDSKPGT